MPVILITGGTGLIGKNLTRHLTNKGYEVIIMSRGTRHTSQKPMVSFANWDVDEGKFDSSAIAKADFIIHLAGANVMAKRWTKNYKQEIVESRTRSSELIIKALEEIPNNVKAVISASAVGWYGTDAKPLLHKYGFIETDPAAEDFLGETCRLWEQSVKPVTRLNKRLVILRTGIVLSNDGGALAEFKKPLRFGIAPIIGSGKQIISWIHIDDLCRMYSYAIENTATLGTYNAAAPQPVTNKNFISRLAQLVRNKFYIPVYAPAFILKLFLGEKSIEILKSTTVSSAKIKETGFTFMYPTINAALKELTGKS
ncbi:MAG TPA: TIGR01777 family oxidoreductase [Chitinophagaceae bacterium]|nr:TIGR01777 family oxidoreductase [Chitinophagaceae bacterium]